MILTTSTAVEGSVSGFGGWGPLSTTTAASTATRQASHPRMNPSPFRVPCQAPRIRMKATSGNGSRVIASPRITRSSSTPTPPEHPLLECAAERMPRCGA